MDLVGLEPLLRIAKPACEPSTPLGPDSKFIDSSTRLGHYALPRAVGHILRWLEPNIYLLILNGGLSIHLS